MDDYEANNKNSKNDDEKDPEYEYSEGNLSNVFNLEGEDYSHRNYHKKVKGAKDKVKEY